jgi:hypothetical protein
VDNETIFEPHHVIFDKGDQCNGCLYLCLTCGLWSAQTASHVEEQQKQAYISQLRFQSYRSFAPVGIERFTVARFEHLKYPSDAARWEAWLTCLDTEFGVLTPATGTHL